MTPNATPVTLCGGIRSRTTRTTRTTQTVNATRSDSECNVYHVCMTMLVLTGTRWPCYTFSSSSRSRGTPLERSVYGATWSRRCCGTLPLTYLTCPFLMQRHGPLHRPWPSDSRSTCRELVTLTPPSHEQTRGIVRLTNHQPHTTPIKLTWDRVAVLRGHTCLLSVVHPTDPAGSITFV